MADQNPKNLDINITDLHKRLDDLDELVKPIKGDDGSCGPYWDPGSDAMPELRFTRG